MNKTVYTTRRENDGTFTALVLHTKTREVLELTYFLDMDELYSHIQETYGNIERISPRAFQEELDRRAIHTPEMVEFLQNNPEGDLSGCWIYGSPYRPMSRMWASIDEATYIDTDWTSTHCHSYVVVPAALDKETIDRYQLVFVSHPEERA